MDYSKLAQVVIRNVRDYVQPAIDAVCKRMDDADRSIRSDMTAIEKRLEALEAGHVRTLADSYKGTWQHGTYERGALVTDRGSCWLCTKDSTARPGETSD